MKPVVTPDPRGTNRALTPRQEAAVRSALKDLPVVRSGHPSERSKLIRALAAQYGVSTRCIHRTMERAPKVVVEVEVGKYKAVFEDGPEGPIQLTPWFAA
jgi:hypothetical protein